MQSALTHAVDRARPPLDHARALVHARTTDLYSALEHSENPAAQAIVQLIAHPHVQATYARASTLASDHAPLLVSVLGLAIHLYLANRSQQRTDRRFQEQLDRYDMSDYGLGTPAGAAGAAGASRNGRSRDDHGLVEVQWSREKLRVPLPPPASPLSALRATLYNLTGVPPSHQKLIYSGAVLKDDLAPLSAYGLIDEDPSSSATDGDGDDSTGARKSFWDSWSFAGRANRGRKLKKLVMLGSKDVSARVDDRLAQRKDLADLAAAATAPEGAAAAGPAAGEKQAESEEALRARIRDVAGQKLDELEPQVRQVEDWLSQAQTQAQTDSAAAAAAEKPSAPTRTLLFLSEVLLQGLLKLDSIEIPSGYADARRERKDAVRRVQETLDRVDAAKEGWKKLGTGLAP